MVKSHIGPKMCFFGKEAAGETEVVTPVLMNRMPYSLVHQYQRDRRPSCFRLQSSSRELRSFGGLEVACWP
jgi:hypothetical protein